MNTHTKPVISAKKRELVGKKVNSLRRNGFVPAVVYGKNVESKNLSVDTVEFAKLYKEAGGNTIVLLKEEGEKEKNVLIYSVDRDVVNDKVLHVDFLEVKMTEKITAKVPLVFVGDSNAVREMDGMLITNKNEVEIECLPGDLLHEIEVSIEALDDFEKAIHVSDIKVPGGVIILDDGEETVATVEPPRSEEELEELEAPVEENIPEAQAEGEEKEETEAEGEAKKEEKEEGAE